ncbi:MAG: 30S ribosomal protein S9 [Candidatus Gracilibacteria bacterium]|nr:30S ribosomal protein S9 [Candidatus Gracilibacteria bacterium]MDQ7022804.1 30S ribosomal protein S9 [Candidatus Gracilibacteria bacterium]
MAKYIYAVGKRKTASAQVKLFEGAGKDMINGKIVSEYVTRTDLFDVLYSAIRLTKLKDKVYFDVAVTGSGESAQAEAINYGLAKALLEKDSSLRAILKQAGLLTRDARKVERKKPGLHKARKAMQWSKR